MKAGLRINENHQVVLCGNNICCPTLEQLPDGRFRIIDDYGNAIIVTAEQAKLISDGADLATNTVKEQVICG